MQPGTKCVHAGSYRDPQIGGVTTPIHTSSSYEYPNPSNTVYYPRYFNIPVQQAASRKIAALENAEQGLVLSSGMAAITTALMAALQRGDHAVFHAELYGGTYKFVTAEFPRMGIEFSLVESTDPADFERAFRPNTRVLYFETPTNPLLTILDIRALVAIARRRGATTMIDNTFASPINQRPIELGLDLVIHSGTKYLNGHSDLNCGAVVGSREQMEPVIDRAMNHGGTLDVRACYLLERGLKTLELRVARQNENALALARMLSEHPRVRRVYYPGLPKHPRHEIARAQMNGFGGVLAIELDMDEAEAKRRMKDLELGTLAVSLGGVETLLCFPKETSHAKVPSDVRQRMGISDSLIRLSAGIENTADLLADFERVLR